MPFVKALIWIAAVIIIVIFAANNWVPVTIALWGDWLLDTKLPVLIVAAFLLGWLPLYLLHKTGSWRMQRRIRELQAIPTDIPRNYVPDNNPPAPAAAQDNAAKPDTKQSAEASS